MLGKSVSKKRLRVKKGLSIHKLAVQQDKKVVLDKKLSS